MIHNKENSYLATLIDGITETNSDMDKKLKWYRLKKILGIPHYTRKISIFTDRSISNTTILEALGEICPNDLLFDDVLTVSDTVRNITTYTNYMGKDCIIQNIVSLVDPNKITGDTHYMRFVSTS